jgi:hypothetical protein
MEIYPLKIVMMPSYLIQEIPVWRGWQRQFWKWHLPLKVILFFWLAIHNIILTWDILQKKGWIGPSYCCLCGQMAEDNTHLFIECIFTKSVWEKCAHMLNFNQPVGWTLPDELYEFLGNEQTSFKKIVDPDMLVYMERTNKTLFDGNLPSAWAVVFKILGALKLIIPAQNSQRLRQNPILRINGYSLAFSMELL